MQILQHLQTHIRKKKHCWNTRRANTTERKDIKTAKLEALQDDLPKVKWGYKDVNNCLRFAYLGSLFQTDGDLIPDIREKCDRDFST